MSLYILIGFIISLYDNEEYCVKSVAIHSRLGDFSGKSNNHVAFFDCFDKKSGKMIRHFVLLQYGVKLMFEPWGWKNEWYGDFIDITCRSDSVLDLDDLYLDIIIQGNGPTYRIIDAEELADAFEKGKIFSEKLCLVLRNLQKFVDDHLHQGRDFPPRKILPYILK